MKTSVCILLLIGLMNAQSCDKYCLRCSSSGGCQVCNAALGYVRSSSNTCVPSANTACSSVGDNNYCYKCATAGQVPVNGVCTANPADPNCLLYASANYCNYCTSGFYPSGSACVSVGAGAVANCAAHRSPFVCRVCKSGYYQNGGLCFANPANCLVVQVSGCSACAANYFFEYTTPLTAFDYSTYNNQLARQSLLGSHEYIGNSCVTGYVPNCATYSAINVCTSCVSGYYLNNSNTCVIFPTTVPLCTAFNTAGVCTACGANSYLSNGACIAVSAGASGIANCVLYNSATSCARCATGYYLVVGANNVGTCAAFGTSTQVPNCAYYSQVNNQVVCSACAAGFYLSSATGTALCYSSNLAVSNCLIFNPNGLCQYCAAGFFLNASGTACTAITVAAIANCQSYNSAQVCVACQAGFFLSATNTCVQATGTIGNCAIYGNNGQCVGCSGNF